MDFIADLHLHSKYSRAVSQDMILPTMARWARIKGINILTASDWTHPLWFREIKGQMEEAFEGLYKLKTSSFAKAPASPAKRGESADKQNTDVQKEPLFLLSTEIASIYSEKGKLRRIHNLVFVPSFEVVEKVNKELQRRGCNLMSDGRPIIGISSKNLLELLLSIDEKILLIPCHIWTPHFGIYGSASGYDFLEEAFEELSRYVYGIETGISSDPEMNWRIKELENRSILSFSDAHSAPNMAREATAFDLETPSYKNIRNAIMRKGGVKNRITYTVEFYPEEGKYHYSGHRNCAVVLSPKETKEKGRTCPECLRPLTEGVAIRIEQLGGEDFANVYEEKVSKSGVKWYIDKSRNHPPYVKLVRLMQIVAAALDSTESSMKVKAAYQEICESLGSELKILLKTPLANIEKVAGPKVALGVDKVRGGGVKIDPGFDGAYGKVKIWDDKVESSELKVESEEEKEQLGLF